MAGEAMLGFCGVRPSGHHAEPDRAMGFCLFNNVALAAEFVIRELGARRVFILDWDVHHGNGPPRRSAAARMFCSRASISRGSTLGRVR
jgi:acetoin utilization deacetylase AcuC-like enzyme